MELELGLKITKTRDDASSSTDFRISKDPFGPLSFSRETNTVFVLIIHLKGFKKEGIEIDINKEGNRIKISGKKPVEEMVLVKWVAWKKEVEIKSFKKVFRIPEIVDLDKIKARFDEEEGTLKIKLPKRVKGITGLKIEEEDEEEERVEPQEEKKEEIEEKKEPEEVTPPQEEQREEEKTEKITEDPKTEEQEPERDEEEDKIEELVEEETMDREEVGEVEEEKEKDEGNDKRRRRKRKRCCFPFLAGSSLLMSIIFFIIHLIESKSKKK